jgi:hypothetical protein
VTRLFRNEICLQIQLVALLIRKVGKLLLLLLLLAII